MGVLRGLILFLVSLCCLSDNCLQPRGKSILRRSRNINSDIVSIVEDKVYIEDKVLDIVTLTLNSEKEVEVHVVLNEEINGERHIDWGRGIIYIGDEAIYLDAFHATFDELIVRGDRGDLVEQFQEAHPDEEIIAVLPNGNTMFNDWFVSFVNGELFYNTQEPIFKRTYSSLVVWEDGGISIEDINFEDVDASGQIKVINSLGGEDITDKILYTTFGQRLIKDGDVVNLVDIYDEFDDLGHLFYFPLIPVEGREIIGGPLVGKMHEDKTMVKAALEGEAIDFALEDLAGIAANELRERLNQSGYREVANSQNVINQGEYVIEDNNLSIKLIRNQYRHFIAGVKEGQLVTISILGKSGSHGATIEEAAEIAERHGLEDAVLLCNGRDVWLNHMGEWVEDTGREGISSVIIISGVKGE
ncbi:MAG: hypothetical protein P9M06_05075 [Candidatus Saelkia tenebricola]|nr:hypothetical protein [Candidatus Saelkia tenebricola]